MTIRMPFARVILTFLVTYSMLGWFPGAAVGAPSTASELDGRLGGSLSSFIERLGEPVPSDYYEYGVKYFAVPGVGRFSAMFRPDLTTYDPYQTAEEPAATDLATIVIFSSPRAPDQPATIGAPEDWTLEEAMSRARDFLPSDAEVGDLGDEGDVSFARCESASLFQISAEFAKSSCRIGFVITDAGSVSYVTLALSIDAPQAGLDITANPCAGVVEWAQESATRMNTADVELQRIAGLDENDPSTPIVLGEIEATLRTLSDEQRASASPTVTATANRLLADAFLLYADSIGQVIDGLEQNDGALIEEAIAGIERANGWVTQVNRLIERGATGCGLELTNSATPVP